MIHPTKAIGQIAAELPGSIPVLEKFGLDYCCHGDQSLEQACLSRGLSPDAIVAEIEAAVSQAPEPARDWTRATVSELIDHILEKHHEYLRAELPALEHRLKRTREAHPSHAALLEELERTYFALQEELYGHLHKEEMILFPTLRGLEEAVNQQRPVPPPPFGTVNNPIRVMRMEHDNAAVALAKMRSITGNYTLPADACATWEALYRGLQELEADLHIHIHLENNILFPRAVELEAKAGLG